MAEPILQVNHLSVNFHTYTGVVKALRDVSFSLNQGEILAIVGESGSGKTVMGKSILRLHKHNVSFAEESQIIFQGRDIQKMSNKELREIRGNKIAMIFQDAMTSLDPTMTVEKQIGETLKIHQNMSGGEQREKIIELLKMVEIPDPEARMKNYPHQLSGGMRQRIMIAMALACKPQILIADEPTTALDVTIQAQLLELLKELRRKLNMSIIIVTHDLSVAADFADRIMVMYAGKILEYGSVDEIFGYSRHPYTWSLLQATPSQFMKRKSALVTIKGTPPDMRLLLEHCPFAARCSYCMGVCRKAMPKETKVTDSHEVSCWLLDTRAPKVLSPVGDAGKQI